MVFVCVICVEPKSLDESFAIEGCGHVYCIDCMVSYVKHKLEENITKIPCPEPSCGCPLGPECCRFILPLEVAVRWGNALCESAITGSQKFYCPFKDCSAMLIDDNSEAQVIKQSECPYCNRLFCAQCKVAWHAEMGCEEFQKLHKDERQREDIMLMHTADKMKWRRCPACRIYVERIQGCRFIKCRCGASFCYVCGSTMINQGSHHCPSCNAVW